MDSITIEELYSKHRLQILKEVNSVSRSLHADKDLYDEIEAQAYLLFCEAAKNFNPSGTLRALKRQISNILCGFSPYHSSFVGANCRIEGKEKIDEVSSGLFHHIEEEALLDTSDLSEDGKVMIRYLLDASSEQLEVFRNMSPSRVVRRITNFPSNSPVRLMGHQRCKDAWAECRKWYRGQKQLVTREV